MFSENQKISLRQTYRLFVFDLLGVGTLLLPTQLARLCGNDGIICILFGGILGFGYLFLLGAALKKMRMDVLEYACNHKISLLGIHEKAYAWMGSKGVTSIFGFVQSVVCGLLQ